MIRKLGEKNDGDGQQFRQAESKVKHKTWRQNDWYLKQVKKQGEKGGGGGKFPVSCNF